MNFSANRDPTTTRGPDRRWHVRSPQVLPPGCRDGLDGRAMTSATARTGAARTGFSEAEPPRERRRFPESGSE